MGHHWHWVRARRHPDGKVEHVLGPAVDGRQPAHDGAAVEYRREIADNPRVTPDTMLVYLEDIPPPPGHGIGVVGCWGQCEETGARWVAQWAESEA